MSASSNRKTKVWMISGLIFGLIILCVAVSSITSKFLLGQADWQQHDNANGHQWLHEELNLTAEEAAAVDEFEPEYRQQRAELQAQFQTKVEQLRKEITTSDEFSDRAKQMIHELHIIHGKLQELSIHHYYQMMHVLPAEKQAHLRDIAAKALSVPSNDGMDPDDPTDDTLIERIGRGDEHALVLLMERHKQALFRFVYRYLNNEADSTEITEATFFKVYQNAAGFKPKASPKTWIYTIALNLARDRLRKDKKRLGQLSLDAPVNTRGSEQPLADRMGSDEPSPSRSLQTDDDLQRIQKQVAQLPEKLKFPFVFCILEKHSYDECAAILKTSRKTVETRIYRARQTLKKQLTDFFEKI